MTAAVYLLLDSSGLAVNAYLWDGETALILLDGYTGVPAPDGVGVGWTFAGGQWTAPPPPVPVVPDEVTNWQAREVLLNTPATDGTSANLHAQVDAYIQGAKAQNMSAWIVWEYGNTFLRHSPLIEALLSALGLSDAVVDQMFIAAAALQ